MYRRLAVCGPLAVGLVLGLGGCNSDGSSCTLRDPALAAAVAARAKAAGVAESQITDLNADGVDDLHGIGCFARLQSLTLQGSFDDVSPLAQLQELLTLTLSSTTLSHLAGLGSLAKLWVLDLHDSPVDTFDGLAGAPALKTLWSHGARSASGLHDLPALTEMSLEYSPITSLAGLERTPLLGRMYLGFSQLTSFVGLGEQPSLSYIDARASALTSLAGLAAAAPNLTELSVPQTAVSTLADLSGLTKLAYLDLYGAPVTSLAELGGTPSLRSLQVAATSISSLQGVEALLELVSLFVDGTSIDSLAPVVGLRKLRTLTAKGTGVADLEPLRGLPDLDTLDLERTKVSEISALADLPLTRLNLAQTKVNEVDALHGMPWLTDLDISSTGVADLSPLTGLPLANLAADRTAVESLDGLTNLRNLRTFTCSHGSLTSLGAIDSLGPALLDVTENPLSPEALQTIDRLCSAGWAVFWDGGICGSPCRFQSCTL